MDAWMNAYVLSILHALWSCHDSKLEMFLQCVRGKWLRMGVKMCSGRFQEESEVASKCLAWQTLTYLNRV